MSTTLNSLIDALLAKAGQDYLAEFIAVFEQLKTEIATAVAATAGASITATSATSIPIGTGSKTLTVETGKAFVPPMQIEANDTADPATNYMRGTVTAYISGTGQLDFTVPAGGTGGSGTKSSWTVRVIDPIATQTEVDERTDGSKKVVAARLAEGLDLKGSDIASATALLLPALGNVFDVTGTTTITSISSRAAGRTVILQFDGALTLTHNGTSLILPGAANITTAAGDVADFVSEGDGNWRLVGYVRGAGLPLTQGWHTVGLLPGNFKARTSNGCGSATYDGTTSGKDFKKDVITFDTTTAQVAYADFPMPAASNGGDIKVQTICRLPSASSTQTGIFAVKARYVGAGTNPASVDWGSAGSAVVTATATATQLLISALSANITPGGTYTEGCALQLRLERDVATDNGAGNLELWDARALIKYADGADA